MDATGKVHCAMNGQAVETMSCMRCRKGVTYVFVGAATCSTEEAWPLSRFTSCCAYQHAATCMLSLHGPAQRQCTHCSCLEQSVALQCHPIASCAAICVPHHAWSIAAHGLYVVGVRATAHAAGQLTDLRT